MLLKALHACNIILKIQIYTRLYRVRKIKNMKIKERFKRIAASLISIILSFILVFIVCWIVCFFYSAGKLIVQSVSYRGHSTGEVVKIERWMGWHDDAEPYNFNIIKYRYRTEDGRTIIGEEDTNSQKTTGADRFVEEITELNPDIRIGSRQKLLYNLKEPQKVVSEYYRRNQEMFCLLTGLSSLAIVIIFVFVARLGILRNIKRKRENKD